MDSIIKKNGFSYSFDSSMCESCGGKCCTGERGYVFLNQSEKEQIAKLLNLSVEEFINRYLFTKKYKHSIKEILRDGSYDCIFYDNVSNRCEIYKARPMQCRTFPFWEHYKLRVGELKNECKGVVDD